MERRNCTLCGRKISQEEDETRSEQRAEFIRLRVNCQGGRTENAKKNTPVRTFGSSKIHNNVSY